MIFQLNLGLGIVAIVNLDYFTNEMIDPVLTQKIERWSIFAVKEGS